MENMSMYYEIKHNINESQNNEYYFDTFISQQF